MYRQLTPPPPNNCDRLIAVAKLINARPVYQPVFRVGGEDHRPLFSATVQLVPQGYFVDGTGHSKLAARRAAAGNMLHFLHQRAIIPSHDLQYYQNSKPHDPYRPRRSEDEVEDGELPVPDPTPAHQNSPRPLFFVDRDPDPELEVVAQSFAKEENSEQEQEQESPTQQNHNYPKLSPNQPVKEHQKAPQSEHEPTPVKNHLPKEETNAVQPTPATIPKPSAQDEPKASETMEPEAKASPAPSSSKTAPESRAAPSPSPVTTPVPAAPPSELEAPIPSPTEARPVPSGLNVSPPRLSPAKKSILPQRLRSSPTQVSVPTPHSVEPPRPGPSPRARGPQLDPEEPLPRVKRLPLINTQPLPTRSSAMSLDHMMHSTSGSTSSAAILPPEAMTSQGAESAVLRSTVQPSPVTPVQEVTMTKTEPQQVVAGAQGKAAIPIPSSTSGSLQLVRTDIHYAGIRSQQLFPPAMRPLPKPAFPFQPTRRSAEKLPSSVKPEPVPVEGVPDATAHPSPETHESTKPAEAKRILKTVVRSSGPPRKWREGPERADEENIVKDAPSLRRSTRGRGCADLVAPNDRDIVRPFVISVPPSETAGPPSETAVPSRKRADPPSPAKSDKTKNGPVGFVPLRKRARSLVNEGSHLHDLPMRLRFNVLCDLTVDKVKDSLRALIRADLLAEFDLHIFGERKDHKEFESDKVVRVQALPKNGDDEQILFTRLLFEAGKAFERLWIQRAKHLADGYPPALCPRVIIIHDSPLLACLSKPGVIEILKPEVAIVGHIGKLLEAATKQLTSL